MACYGTMDFLRLMDETRFRLHAWSIACRGINSLPTWLVLLVLMDN